MPRTWQETTVFGHSGAVLENGRKTGLEQDETAKGFWPPPFVADGNSPGLPSGTAGMSQLSNTGADFHTSSGLDLDLLAKLPAGLIPDFGFELGADHANDLSEQESARLGVKQPESVERSDCMLVELTGTAAIQAA
jgi:hypothetical protein